jgi:hypothetical protein
MVIVLDLQSPLLLAGIGSVATIRSAENRIEVLRPEAAAMKCPVLARPEAE